MLPRIVRHVALLIASVSCAAAQDRPPAKPAFEVASVRPSVYRQQVAGGPGVRGNVGGCPTSLRIDRARVEFRCATLPMLIGYAYHHSPDRLKGPEWMMSPGATRFDISATVAPGTPANQIPDMVRSLLAERFQLALHDGVTHGQVLALVVAKGGLRMTRAEPGEPEPASNIMDFYGTVETRTAINPDGSTAATILTNPRMGIVRQTEGPDQLQRWEAANISLPGLADLLDKVIPISIPIVDMTGESGRYRMVLEVSLADVSAEAGIETSVLNAANAGLRRLGLELQRRAGNVSTLIVDRVERAPSGN